MAIIRDAPEGMKHYIYVIKSPSGDSYGGFIGTDPAAIMETPIINDYPPGTPIHIMEVSKEQFFNFEQLLETKKNFESGGDLNT